MTQPPQKNMPASNTLRSYIRSLRVATEQKLADSERKSAPAKQANWEPIETQIQRWWANLPPTMQQRRFQIVGIAAQCYGRFRTRPALRQVAAALRSSGWREVRDWTNAGRNRRLWEPGD
jgi:hypothetical protein